MEVLRRGLPQKIMLLAVDGQLVHLERTGLCAHFSKQDDALVINIESTVVSDVSQGVHLVHEEVLDGKLVDDALGHTVLGVHTGDVEVHVEAVFVTHIVDGALRQH